MDAEAYVEGWSEVSKMYWTAEIVAVEGVVHESETGPGCKDYYYLAAEYHFRGSCKGTFIAWDARLLQ